MASVTHPAGAAARRSNRKVGLIGLSMALGMLALAVVALLRFLWTPKTLR